MTETIRRAFVLGAGLGTRLRLLTEERPKPLVPIFHKPLITFAFDHLRQAGVKEFVVNTHHCPEAYDSLLGARDGLAHYEGCSVAFRHEPVLLDTGGGIRNVADLLGDEPFFVQNGDVLADLPLERLVQEHFAGGNAVTLALRRTGGPLHVQFDPQTGRVTDIRGAIGGRSEPGFLFTGVYLLSPSVFRHIPPEGICSVIPVFLNMVRAGERVGAVVLDEGLWFDLGTRESYFEVHRLFAKGATLSYPLDQLWPQPIHPSARVDASASLNGLCAIGPDVEVGAEVVLDDCILWEGAKIAPCARLETCIVRDGRHAGGVLRGMDL